MKVLYITGAAAFGGASRSLYEALRSMPPDTVKAHFVSTRGTALDVYRQTSSETIGTWGIFRFDHTYYGYYRGIRWAILLREAARVPFTVAALIRARRRWRDIDLIHVNEFIELGPALIAKALFKVPLVVHVRALANTNRRLLRTRILHRLLREADALIAIDESVRATLPSELPVQIVHNSFDPSPLAEPDESYLRRLEDLRPSSLKVGFIGNLFRFKGPAELLEALEIVKARGDDVQVLVIGGSAAPEHGPLRKLLRKLGVTHNIGAELARAVANKGLSHDFLLLGATKDIQRVLPKVDVLAFPSHGDAAGRPVFEAAFFNVPSIVAVRQPKPDTLVHGVTGIAIPHPDPQLLANAISSLNRDREALKRMGANARQLAERNFRPEVNARKLVEVYQSLILRDR